MSQKISMLNAELSIHQRILKYKKKENIIFFKVYIYIYLWCVYIKHSSVIQSIVTLIQIISSTISDEQLLLPDWCWMRNEWRCYLTGPQ